VPVFRPLFRTRIHVTGQRFQHGGQEVVVITPQAPLGQQLVGRKSGDRFKWGTGAAALEYRIIAGS
jgi:hypothetical protein